MSRHQPALLGGLFIGVFSALPIVGAANLCCCLWVVAGGLLTAYLQQQARPEPIDAGGAMLAGMLAGLIGAAIYSVAIVLMASTPIVEEQLRVALDNNPQVPVEVRDRLLDVVSGGNIMLLVVMITLPIYAAFGALGALLGVALFRKTPPAPAGS